MQKLNLHTKNKADENFEKLSKLFPNAITETVDENGQIVRAIDKDVLMQEISHTVVEGKEERYQFTWPDKKQSIVTANAPINKTLRPCKEESKNFDDTENLYIEGDNLEVLKLLQETYLGKVKMIYIDPPYNTGNDFVYEDDFAQSTSEYMENSGQYDEDGNRLFKNMDSNGRFHTDWLNMIYPRLKLARDLLTDDGVMFISIDDNEVENLKKVCNEVFGESNFITTIHVELSATQGMKVKAAKEGNIVKNAEYILIYSRQGKKNIANTILYDYRPDFDSHYAKFLSENMEVTNLKDEFEKVYPREKIRDLTTMYREKETFRTFVNENVDKIFADDKVTGFDINEFEVGKVYVKEKLNKKYYIINNGKKLRQLLPLKDSFGKCDDFNKSYGLRKIRGDWWKEFYKDMGNVTKEGEMQFENGKKPVRLLKQIVKMCSDVDSIILDFFSGSATTAHAVMQLNSEDDGNRKFIMVQLPEETEEKSEAYKAGYKNICEIGKERIRRAGDKIASEVEKENSQVEIDKEPKNVPDIGFRVLKCDSSNMKDIYYKPEDILQTSLDALISNIKEDRTPDDLLFQVMLDLGVLLSSEIKEIEISGKKVFDVAGNYLIACFDNDITEGVIEEIAKKKPYYFVMRDSSLKDSSVSVNFEQLFKAYSPDTVRMVI